MAASAWASSPTTGFTGARVVGGAWTAVLGGAAATVVGGAGKVPAVGSGVDTVLIGGTSVDGVTSLPGGGVWLAASSGVVGLTTWTSSGIVVEVVGTGPACAISRGGWWVSFQAPKPAAPARATKPTASAT